MNDEIKAVYKYAKTNTTVSIILSVLIIVVGIIGVISIGTPGAIAIVLGLGIIFFSLYKDKSMQKQLLELGQDEQEAIIRDFSNGKNFLNDKLRAGDTFVIGAKTGIIRKISDIQQVYQSVHRTNGIEDRRIIVIKVLDKNGQLKKENLCYLHTKSLLKDKAPDDDELMQVIKHMLSINPNIHLGYK